MASKIRIAALISGGGTNLQAVIDACDHGRIDGAVVCVGSDNPRAKGLERARLRDIPTFIVDYVAHMRRYNVLPPQSKWPEDLNVEDLIAKQSLWPEDLGRSQLIQHLVTRAMVEAELLKAIQPYRPDLIILAGFMRVLSPYFIDNLARQAGRLNIMNIHPALLPAFPGVDGYGDTYRYGCKVGGCTVHFVDYGEDSGPIIGQKTYDIEPHDTIASIKTKGLQREWELYPKCIQLFAEDRLQPVKMTYTLSNGQIVRRTVVKIVQTTA
jgi:phosphoribosylglycinamide formyltransferase-1